MKKLILLFWFIPVFANAQNTFKVIVTDSLTHELLIGATAILKGTDKGGIANRNGEIEIDNIPDGKQTFIFSYVGYKSRELTYMFPLDDSLWEQTIYLSPESENLNEVIVTSTRTNSRIENIPLHIEVIGRDEVNEESSITPGNISKLLLESASVQAQQTSAVTGNVSIRLQGLDGKYTQILKDGFPVYSGFAQGLSVLEIPPLDLKQVEIIKGSSSSLYGSDAIAGIINLISKQPHEKRDLTLLVNRTSLKGTDANAYFSKRWKKLGLTFLTSNNFQTATDVSNNGFSDLPEARTFNIAPTIYWYFNPETTLLFGFSGTCDYRKGGDMKVLENHTDSVHRYFEQSVSRRYYTHLKFEKQFSHNRSFTLKNSVSYFDRVIDQPLSAFKGRQTSSYTEASFKTQIAKHIIVAGLDLATQDFSEDTARSRLQRNYDYFTAGLFLQDNWKPADKIVLLAGFRTDNQNRYGIFLLPRLAVKYNISREFYIRAGGGLGYKVPEIFSTESEQDGINNIRSLSGNVKAEKSIGGNIDLNYKELLGEDGQISFNQSFFITQINNPLVLDSLQFVSKSLPVVTSGFETNLRLDLDELEFFVAYTYVNARRKYDPTQSIIPLTPKHKINLDIIYEDEDNYSLALEGYYVSSMFRDLDTKTRAYFTVGLIAQKHFKHLSIIANCENLTDVRQTRFENIIIPPTGEPGFRQIYAPLEGRVFNIALRFRI